MKKTLLFIFLIVISNSIFAQNERPKLVVGVVVDQMRADYLYKFWDNYSENGFKRMVNEGYNCRNTHYDYVPTNTGPGHASIFTGAYPSLHGVVDNDSYDRYAQKEYYCAADADYTGVGGKGSMSPKRLQTTTLGDEINLYQNFKSKSIGFSLKDRGAIFPAGHSGQAYWLTGQNFMTSTFYMNELPKWVQKFNEKRKVKEYLSGKWEPFLAEKKYRFSDENNEFEARLANTKDPKFPYDLAQVLELSRNYELIKSTPFGNSLLVDIAIEAIDNESLGKDEFTDMLSLSFSSSDYIGHQYGTEAMELEDSYYRLDNDLARLFAALDEKVGKGEYLLFLTSDHGAAYNPGFLNSHSIPGGTINRKELKEELDSLIDISWGQSDWVEYMGSNQIFLNHASIVKAKLKLRDAQDHVMKLFLALPNIEKVYTSYSLMTGQMTEDMGERVQKGFNQKWGGDLVYLLKPQYISGSNLGTTHGSGYAYDSHVPLLWMGWNIPKGETWEKVNITDIASTIAAMINVNRPSGAFGEIIDMKK